MFPMIKQNYQVIYKFIFLTRKNYFKFFSTAI